MQLIVSNLFETQDRYIRDSSIFLTNLCVYTLPPLIFLAAPAKSDTTETGMQWIFTINTAISIFIMILSQFIDFGNSLI